MKVQAAWSDTYIRLLGQIIPSDVLQEPLKFLI
jgi:hypothetical protein